MRRFVGSALVPSGDGFVTAASGNEPPVPRAFSWGRRTLAVTGVVRSWRSTKSDRGDVYLKRHWFELTTDTNARLEVYYDRASRRGTASWWLYTIEEAGDE